MHLSVMQNDTFQKILLYVGKLLYNVSFMDIIHVSNKSRFFFFLTIRGVSSSAVVNIL